MRTPRALSAGLALVCVAVAGCGVSSKEEVKPRDPSGEGLTRGPDVAVESTDELRATPVVLAGDGFQPRQVSVSIDSTVRIINRGERTARIRALRGIVNPILNTELSPGETAEVSFSETGPEVIAVRGSDARLQINVLP